MLQITTNIDQVLSNMLQRFISPEVSKEAMREVSVALLPVIKTRIHEEGQAADGGGIGTYSSNYMKLRTGEFGNSKRISRGTNKGKVKDSGTHTKGDSAGKARPTYNRSGDTKVILSLTRQMENDFSVQPTATSFGLGYNNTDNYMKAVWNEEKYNKKIFALTDGERQLAIAIAKQSVTNALVS